LIILKLHTSLQNLKNKQTSDVSFIILKKRKQVNETRDSLPLDAIFKKRSVEIILLIISFEKNRIKTEEVPAQKTMKKQQTRKNSHHQQQKQTL